MTNQADSMNGDGAMAAAHGRVRRVLVAAPGGVWKGQHPRQASRADQAIVGIENDLTVIRGQAQLIERELAAREAIDPRLAGRRVAAIISSVDEATLELHHLEAARRTR